MHIIWFFNLYQFLDSYDDFFFLMEYSFQIIDCSTGMHQAHQFVLHNQTFLQICISLLSWTLNPQWGYHHYFGYVFQLLNPSIWNFLYWFFNPQDFWIYQWKTAYQSWIESVKQYLITITKFIFLFNWFPVHAFYWHIVVFKNPQYFLQFIS